jgi:hypothetical protein
MNREPEVKITHQEYVESVSTVTGTDSSATRLKVSVSIPSFAEPNRSGSLAQTVPASSAGKQE